MNTTVNGKMALSTLQQLPMTDGHLETIYVSNRNGYIEHVMFGAPYMCRFKSKPHFIYVPYADHMSSICFLRI